MSTVVLDDAVTYVKAATRFPDVGYAAVLIDLESAGQHPAAAATQDFFQDVLGVLSTSNATAEAGEPGLPQLTVAVVAVNITQCAAEYANVVSAMLTVFGDVALVQDKEDEGVTNAHRSVVLVATCSMPKTL
jgi:hypothetical protein